jgi:RNA-directed DNA polymerase
MTPEPEDKLDATTNVVVNGPEDAALAWRQIDWRRAEAEVRRLRQRIFTASKAGDLARVRQLQKLMLRSRSNTLVSVRRVTERNAGRLTAGVDGEVALTPEAKMKLVDRIQHRGRAVQGPAGQTRIHPQARKPEAPTTRNSRAPRPVPPGTGRERVGARVGS